MLRDFIEKLLLFIRDNTNIQPLSIWVMVELLLLYLLFNLIKKRKTIISNNLIKDPKNFFHFKVMNNALLTITIFGILCVTFIMVLLFFGYKENTWG